MTKSTLVLKLVGVVAAAATSLALNAQTPAAPASGTPPAPPMGAGHPPPGHPALTKDQMDCLHKELGAPSKTNRPSPQKMQAAFKTCNIQMPGKPPAK